VYKSPTNDEGYDYKFAICGEIPKAELPHGCKTYTEHPSVVKYKPTPANSTHPNCIEIGSIGPCSQGECGMTGAPSVGGGVVVTYTYTYGCKNTVTLTMTPGNASAPGQVTTAPDQCNYTTSWAGIGPPQVLAAAPAPPPPYETVHAATFEPSKPATIQQQVIPSAGGQVREGDPPANGYVAIIDNAAAHFGVCERDRLAWMDARAFASR